MVEMNTSWSAIPYLAMVIIAITIIPFVQTKYEPIYLVDTSEEPHVVYNVRQEGKNQRYIVQDPFLFIFAACPQSGSNDLLKMVDFNRKTMVVESICEQIIESRVHMLNTPSEELSVVGFTLNTDFLKNSPARTILKLIQFKFEASLRRIKFLRYFIASGKLLKSEVTARGKDHVAEYQKNKDIYGYDVDFLYSQTKLPLVKVRLAPEEDFFFDNWKSASRHNILTAPMWCDLLPQWQALEIFIRKVTRVIDFAAVTTGIHDTLTLRGNNSDRKLYLHDGQQSVPKYFWKVIYSTVELDGQAYKAGILFVMHNFNPNTPDIESDGGKICPNDDLSQAGWNFSDREEFKSQIYSCLYNETNMKIFGEKPIEDCEIFDLNNTSVLETVDEGRTIMKKINVLNEIRGYEQNE